MSSIASKLKWEMVCTACGHSRPTNDISEIYGVIPVFCFCGEIMVPEVERESSVMDAPKEAK